MDQYCPHHVLIIILMASLSPRPDIGVELEDAKKEELVFIRVRSKMKDPPKEEKNPKAMKREKERTKNTALCGNECILMRVSQRGKMVQLRGCFSFPFSFSMWPSLLFRERQPLFLSILYPSKCSLFKRESAINFDFIAIV